MTGNPLRPEEERSLHEAHPEVDVPPRPTSLQEQAQALVTRWQNELAIRFGSATGIDTVVAGLVLTNDVRDRMRDDIIALLNDTISREHNTP